MEATPTVFRKEAIESHSHGSDGGRNDVLRIAPGVAAWIYWLLIALFGGSFLYMVVGRVDEYAQGTGLIRAEGRTIVTSITAGTIRRIAIEPGEKVHLNQPLLYFDDQQEQIELSRLQADLNLQQVNRLKNPNDAVAHQQVAALRTQIGAATTRLKEKTVVAPSEGIVQDIRIHSNQFVNPGELLLTIAGEKDRLSVLAILPGYYRPLLKKGEPLRLELTGFRYAYQHVTIDEVGNEVVGPSEIRRFLGQEISDSLTLEGSSVIVQAHLPSRTFEADGRLCEYHDGMHVTAEARVRSQRILTAIVPGLKALLGEER